MGEGQKARRSIRGNMRIEIGSIYTRLAAEGTGCIGYEVCFVDTVI